MGVRLWFLTLWVAGCGATANRPLDDSPEARAVSALFRDRPGPRMPATPRVEVALVAIARGSRVDDGTAPVDDLRRAGSFAPAPGEALDGSDVLFDLGPAPVDIGLPLTVDFGVGEAPYDDGTTPLHRGCVGPGGFSDTVLSFVWRQPVALGVSLQARAAMAREQDLALLEGLPDARFAFAVFGVSVSF